MKSIINNRMLYAIVSSLLIGLISGCGNITGSDPDSTAVSYTRVILGQSTATGSSANQGSTAASTTLSSPTGVYASSSQLFVADTSNNRILIWNTIPTTTGTAASLVLGQASLTTSTAGTSLTTLSAPTSVFVTGTKLIAADKTNNRVLIWNTIPTANQAAASVVAGQASVSTSATSNAAAGMNTPVQTFSDGTKLFVVDQGNNRVLIYSTIPTAATGASANFVVGQTGFNLGTAATTQAGLKTPTAVYSDGTRLFVADGGNNRVLIYNTVPGSNGANADVVLGQSSFTAGSANAGATAPTSSSMSNPTGVWTYGTKLYVADTGNNRILIWNTIPTANNQAADSQQGQSNFITATANGGAIASGTVSGPMDLKTDGTTFWIADTGNHRVVSVTPSY